MFHDDREWCIIPATVPEQAATVVAGRKLPHCAAVQIGDYLLLNDSLPEDPPTDFAVVRRLDPSGGRYEQVASLTLGYFTYDVVLDIIRRLLAGERVDDFTAVEVQPRVRSADEHQGRECAFCS